MSQAAFNALKKVVQHKLTSVGFERALLHKLQLISGGNGKCCCELKVTDQMINSKGTLHGGVTCSLVDAVSTYAVTTVGTGELGVSTDLNVSFMRPASLDDTVVIEATTLSRGRTLAIISVDISSKTTGKLLAQGRHTKYMIEAKR